MADPLSYLRQYHMKDKTIKETKHKIIFGGLSWPKTVKTNYMIYGTGKDGQETEYYTLGCLLFLLKNVNLSHPVYIRHAAAKNIPVVTRPDRKDLLAYLNGKIKVSASVDKSAHFELPTQIEKRTNASQKESSPKKPRLIVEETTLQKAKETLAARLDAPREIQTTITDTSNIKSLSESMSVVKIAEIKAKRLSQKRTTIKTSYDAEILPEVRAMLDNDYDDTKYIKSKEREGRTRTTILQSAGKEFNGIFAILDSVKAKEEARSNRPAAHPLFGQKIPATSVDPANNPTVPSVEKYNRYNQPGYNRYDQEHLTKDETGGFKINLLSSYSGLPLNTIKGGVVPKKMSPFPVPRSETRLRTPVTPQAKRVSRTPIIIVPESIASLITMYNAKEILQELRFISTEEAKKAQGAKRENEILIHRQRNGVSVPYQVIDNPQKLSPANWERVVAVFVNGPTWQFKGWPWQGNPVDIFSKISAFHIKYDDMPLDGNVAKWAVHVIQLSTLRRHLDKAALLSFWEKVDQFIAVNKPFLRH